jgi:hypothetical protein
VLDISGNENITSSQLLKIFKAISISKTIQELNVSDMDEDMDDSSAEGLINIVNTAPQLKMLKIIGNNITNPKKNQLKKAIADVHTRNPNRHIKLIDY